MTAPETPSGGLGPAAGLYRALFPALFALAAPGWIVKMLRRGGWREKFGERFGLYSPAVPPRAGGALIHAVSVGEMFLGIRIAREAAGLGVRPLTLATTTTTGMAQAAAAGFAAADRVYLPVDFTACQRRMLERLRPAVFASVEAAPWPNLLREARRRGVRTAILNARVSPRSQRRYLAARRVLRPFFAALDAVGAVCEEDRLFWIEMGARPERVLVTGNIKLDVSPPPAELTERLRGALAAAGLGGRRPVVVAGSTFPGEEAMLLRAHRELRATHPGILTILVPRHVERAPGIEREAAALGFRLARRSRYPGGSPEPEADALLVDVTGELRGWYALADAVFVGKSLSAAGGQNPVEPVVAGRRAVFGPRMDNFRAVADDLAAAGLAARISSPEELANALDREIRSTEADRIAARAAALFAPHRGAARRTAELLKSLL